MENLHRVHLKSSWWAASARAGPSAAVNQPTVAHCIDQTLCFLLLENRDSPKIESQRPFFSVTDCDTFLD